MQALVTGGGGFLGRYLVEQLLDRGDSVRILSRQQYPEVEALGATAIIGDVRDVAMVEQACCDVDTVFHVAAIPGIWGKWETFHSINTIGTQNLLEASRKAGVTKFIYTSSPSVVYDGKAHLDADESLPYPESYLCHYPHSKALAERDVLTSHGNSDMSTVALRPHLIWGPRDNHLIPRLLQRAKAGRLIRVGKGDNIVSMAYVENVAAAHLQACDQLSIDAPCGGKAYFINEPEPVNLWNWIDDILACAELPKVKRSVSAGMARCVGSAMEAAFWTFRVTNEPPMTRFLASQLSQSHSYSIENAKRDFSYTPAVSFEEGMKRLAADISARMKP